MSDFQITFENNGGILMPCFPVSPAGEMRVVDGIRYLDCAQAMESLNATEDAVHAVYAAFLQEVGAGPRSRDRASEADHILRQKHAHLSDQHFAEFCEVCRQKGFSPWGKHVWTEIRPGKSGRPELQVLLTADGFFATAMRTGQVEKIVGPEWCGPDRVWVEVWTDSRPPTAARVGVQRRGMGEPAFMTARWDDYAPYTMGNRGEKIYDDFWMKMQSFMLGKCACCLALRRAFAEHFDGVYSPEEMAQSRNPRPPVPPGSRPQAADADPQWSPVAPEDLPSTSRQFHLRLMDYGFGNISARESLIERMRQEMPMMHASNTEAFYSAVIARLRRNPGAYGATVPDQEVMASA